MTRARTAIAAPLALILAVALALGGAVTAAQAFPVGPSVPAGGGSIVVNPPVGSTTTIVQSTPNAIINWTSFDISAGETVVVQQPTSTSVALFRVTGATASALAGTLQSNGIVILINPGGISLASTAVVSGAGIALSTGGVVDADVMDGSPQTFSTVSAAGVDNAGTLTLTNHAAIISARITNSGSITATGGRVTLAAAPTVVLTSGAVTSFTGAGGQNITNTGALRADGGEIDLLSTTAQLNVSGLVQSRTSAGLPGRIAIDAANGTAIVYGGAQVDATGSGAGAVGGDIAIAGNLVVLNGPAAIEASGDGGGGEVDVFAAVSASLNATPADALVIAADARLGGVAGFVQIEGTSTLTGPMVISASGLVAGARGGTVSIPTSATLAAAGGSPTIIARSGSWGARTGTHTVTPSSDILLAGLTVTTSGSASALPIESSATVGPFDYGSGLLEFTAGAITCEAGPGGVLIGTTTLAGLSSTAASVPALATLDLTQPNVEADIAGLGHVVFNKQASGSGPGGSVSLTVTGAEVTTLGGDVLVFLQSSCVNTKVLPATGVDVGLPAGIALLLVAGGLAFVVSRRLAQRR